MQMNQINLDINKSGQIINEPVVLRVGEEDQTITVNLLKDGQPYTSFTTATFFANKPSGAIVANDPANISNGVIAYTVPQALVTEFGKITNAYFLIDGKTSTESFVIAVLQGVNISDDLNDYIPGMGNLNVIYDKWKDKLQTITDELAGIDAPKEVKNVIDNELKNYTDQINELQRRITSTEKQLNALVVPVNAVGTNLLLNTSDDNDVDHPVKLPNADVSTNGGILSRTEEYTQLTTPPSAYKEMFYRFCGIDDSSMHNLNPGQTYTIQGDVSVSKGTVKFRSQCQYPNGQWGDYDGGTSDDLVSYSNSFVHVSYTFTIPNNATAIYISWEVYGYDSTTILRFRRMKLEKGSIATDYSLNPLEISTNANVTKKIQDSAVGTNLLINTNDDNDVGHPVKLPNADISTNGGILSRTEDYTQLTAPPSSVAEMFYRFSDPSTNGLHGLELGQTYTVQSDVSVSKGTVKFRSQCQYPNGAWADYAGGLSDNLVSYSNSFVHVSYTFTIPDNVLGAYISWEVYGYDSTTILRFRRMKLEKGSIATDYSLNPLEISTNANVQTAITNAIKVDVGKTITATDDTGKTVNLKITGIS